MDSTIPRGDLKENASKQREVFRMVNDLKTQGNVELSRNSTLTTAGTGVFTTAFTSSAMPDNSAWRVSFDVVARGSGRRASYLRHALWYRDGGVATQEGADTAISTIESIGGMDVRSGASGNSVIIEVLDDGGAVDVNWSVVVRIKEVL